MADLLPTETAEASASAVVAADSTLTEEEQAAAAALVAAEAAAAAADSHEIGQVITGPTQITPETTLMIGNNTYSNFIWNQENDGFIATGSCGNQFLIKRQFLEDNGIILPGSVGTNEAGIDQQLLQEQQQQLLLEQQQQQLSVAEEQQQNNGVVEGDGSATLASLVADQLAQSSIIVDQTGAGSSVQNDQIISDTTAPASLEAQHLLLNSTTASTSAAAPVATDSQAKATMENTTTAGGTTSSVSQLPPQLQQQNESRRVDLSPIKPQTKPLPTNLKPQSQSSAINNKNTTTTPNTSAPLQKSQPKAEHSKQTTTTTTTSQQQQTVRQTSAGNSSVKSSGTVHTKASLAKGGSSNSKAATSHSSSTSSTAVVNDLFTVRTNEKLTTSTKNYSKKLFPTSTSTLVWITPESRNGNSGGDESGVSGGSKALTTTIEVSQTPDSDDEEEMAAATVNTDSKASTSTINNNNTSRLLKSPQRSSPAAVATPKAATASSLRSTRKNSETMVEGTSTTPVKSAAITAKPTVVNVNQMAVSGKAASPALAAGHTSPRGAGSTMKSPSRGAASSASVNPTTPPSAISTNLAATAAAVVNKQTKTTVVEPPPSTPVVPAKPEGILSSTGRKRGASTSSNNADPSNSSNLHNLPPKNSRKSVSFEMDRQQNQQQQKQLQSPPSSVVMVNASAQLEPMDLDLEIGAGVSGISGSFLGPSTSSGVTRGYFKNPREDSQRIILPSRFFRVAPKHTPVTEYDLEEEEEERRRQQERRAPKETRNEEHCNDRLYGRMVVHTRIQSAPISLKVYRDMMPIKCTQCGLQMLQIKSWRIHRSEGCRGRPRQALTAAGGPKGGKRASSASASQHNGGFLFRASTSSAAFNVASPPPLSDDDLDDVNDEEGDDLEEEEDEEEASADQVATFEGFTERHVVWVETKLGPWPALIEQIIVAQRRLQVSLFDYPRKRNSFKVKMADAKLYDEGLTKKRLNKSTDAQLLIAISNAEKHMRNLCLVDIKSMPSAANVAGEGTSNVDGAGANVDPQPSTSIAGAVTNETGAASGGEPGTSQGQSQAEAQHQQQQIQLTTADHLRIVNFVQSGQAEGHLMGVFRGTVESSRHQNYLASLETEEDGNFLAQVGFGPITEEDSQDALYDYCSNLYKSNFEHERETPITDYVTYVLNVFIPEAIIKAISKLYQVDMTQAENIFNFHSTEQMKQSLQ